MNRKWTLMVVLLFLTSVTTLFAGGGKPSNSGKTELSYYGWTDEANYLQKVVDAFNAKSAASHVTMTILPSSDYDDKLLTMIAGGADLNLFNMRSISLMSRLAIGGNLADLTVPMNDSKFPFSSYSSALGTTTVNGKYYSLPYRNQAFALFYNKKIFDDKKVPYPDNLTWDEYAALAQKLTSGSGAQKIYGGFIPDWLFTPYITLQMGSNLLDKNQAPIRVWLEMLNRLYNVDNSHMSYSEIKSSGADYIITFLNGRAAMLPNGDWVVNDILKAMQNDPSLSSKFQLGVAFLPQTKGTQKTTVGGVTTSVGISAKFSKIGEAYEFASFLSGADGAKILAESGILPAFSDPGVVSVYQKAVGSNGVENLLTNLTVPETLNTPEYGEIMNYYSEEKELYLIGEQSLDKTMQNFFSRRDERLKR